MLWSLFCFGGYSMASRDSGIKKYFLFRFGARHYEKTVPISVINSVMQMNGFPPRAANVRFVLSPPFATPESYSREADKNFENPVRARARRVGTTQRAASSPVWVAEEFS